MREILGGVAIAVGAVLAPGVALAQAVGQNNAIVIAADLDRSDVAGSRSEPDFEPLPILIGSMQLRAGVSLIGGYDSNVLNRNDHRGDAVAYFSPFLNLSRDTSRLAANLRAVGELRRFSRFETENSEEFDLQADGRYEIFDRHSLTASARYARLIEPRSSLGTVADAAEPVSYDLSTQEIGANIDLGAIQITPGVGLEQRNYGAVELIDEGSASQNFRDTRTTRADLRLAYRISGLVSTFASLSYADIEATAANPGEERDSENLSALVGLRGEFSPVVSGEIAVGYRQRDFELARYGDIDGLTYRADLQWYALPLFTFRLRAAQQIRNGGLIETPGIVSNQFTATVYYDFLRNLRLAADLDYEINRFRGIDTRTERPSVRVQAQYRLNRNIALGAYARLLHQDVNGSPIVQSFTSFTAGIGFTVTP